MKQTVYIADAPGQVQPIAVSLDKRYLYVIALKLRPAAPDALILP